MLQFFRKYQSYIYLVVTFVIVISFSFFGTNNVLVTNPVRDQVVFTAIDGEKIRRSDLDEMVMFINTDNQDKQAFGGAWGPNFLNNGVIREDLLKTGLATILANAYMPDLKPELEQKFQKEKTYVPYTHPQAKFISQESIWKTHAPKINEHLLALKSSSTATSEKAFDTRVQLFLNEMSFPSYYAKYLIQSQEKQFNFVVPDQNLNRLDLSLFGYHTVEDWFGPKFIKLSAQFIMNAAKIAEQKGYVVTREETIADLLRNSQLSYMQNINNPNIGVVNSSEYYNEQLRILGMDQNQAVKIWSQVLLFKRLFHDVGNAVFADPLMYQNFSQYANESVEVEEFTLPKDLQFTDYATMQKFEVYLNLIAKRTPEDVKNLKLPEVFLTTAEVSKRYPELVQKRYVVKISEANKNSLASKVSLKETWAFEVDNWELMKEKFPELGVKKSETREDRFSSLESLDDVTRSRIDQFARREIVESHPEWLNEALEKSRERTLAIGLSDKGNGSIFQGLENGADLIKALDAVSLNDKPIRFTANNQHYYLITVLDRGENQEILTFAQANQSGVLDDLLDDKLKAHFQKEKQEKNWQQFEASKELVANDYFADLLKAVATVADEKDKTTGANLAPLRLYGYMQQTLDTLKNDPTSANQLIQVAAEKTADDKLPLNKALNEQWKLVKKEETLSRSEDTENQDLFSLPLKSWSLVKKAPNGDLTYFFVKEKGKPQDTAALFEKMKVAHSFLSTEAQSHYMKKVVGEIQEKNSISLEYLNQPIETMDPQTQLETEAV